MVCVFTKSLQSFISDVPERSRSMKAIIGVVIEKGIIKGRGRRSLVGRVLTY